MKIIDLDEINDISELTKEQAELKKPSSFSEKEKKASKKEKKAKAVRELIKMFFSIAAIIVLTICIVRFIGQRTEVNGSSMETTLSNQDNLIVDKISYRFTEPKRFEIVVFPYRETENSDHPIYYIKRIIGLPGETVMISGGVIYINGKVLEEDYGCEVMKEAKLAASPIVLGEDEYFVLGDNRNHSSDSREFGAVRRDEIIGRAIFRIWPFKKIGTLK